MQEALSYRLDTNVSVLSSTCHATPANRRTLLVEEQKSSIVARLQAAWSSVGKNTSFEQKELKGTKSCFVRSTF